MENTSSVKNSIIYIIPITVIFFNILIILFPSQIISSAKNGLLLWFNNVIPSLLPFIIGANILSLTGFIGFLGTLLEPITQKIFKISGNGAFALIIGLISGYPMGAKITASMYENHQITKIEAQKLIMFTNNSGPLFILGTVAVSMFKIPSIGILILLAHYFSAFTIGIILRYYGNSTAQKSKKNISIKRSIIKLKNDYSKNNMSVGKLLSKSIQDSMETILIIGGFIILFSVLTKMLEITEVSTFLTKTLSPGFDLLDINSDFIFPITTGILEITNGCKNLANFPPTLTTSAIAAGIISWGGFSIHAQAIGFLSKTKIKVSLYFLSKAAQSILAVIYVYILNIFLKTDFSAVSTEAFNPTNNSAIKTLTNSSLNFIFIILIILFFSIIVYTLKNIAVKALENKQTKLK